MKLGKRLKKIELMVMGQYTHIWDCCCDHGLLGAALLARQAAPYIHFADILPDLMRELERKLHHFYPQNSVSTATSQWQIHCLDVAALPLSQWDGKHLVIIAGIGGDLMTELVTRICQTNSTADIDFILCPVHHQFTLRQQLIQLNFSLLDESLIAENKRFYEVLRVSTTANSHSTISPVGRLIWAGNTAEQIKNAHDYLANTLAHYKRVQLSKRADVQHIIDAYSAIKLAKSPQE